MTGKDNSTKVEAWLQSKTGHIFSGPSDGPLRDSTSLIGFRARLTCRTVVLELKLPEE
jgi:hypothetical protein